MQNKLISNREMFRQLLAKDVQAVLDEQNGGTWCDLHTVRQYLQNGAADRHYTAQCSGKGYGYTDYDDRFYRAIQSVNDTGYGLTVRKDKETNRLYVFNTAYTTKNKWEKLLVDAFRRWTVNYSR